MHGFGSVANAFIECHSIVQKESRCCVIASCRFVCWFNTRWFSQRVSVLHRSVHASEPEEPGSHSEVVALRYSFWHSAVKPWTHFGVELTANSHVTKILILFLTFGRITWCSVSSAQKSIARLSPIRRCHRPELQGPLEHSPFFVTNRECVSHLFKPFRRICLQIAKNG